VQARSFLSTTKFVTCECQQNFFCFFLGQGGIALIFVFFFREMEANLAFLLPFVV